MANTGVSLGSATVAQEPEAISFAAFLEDIPPTQQVKVCDLFVKSVRPGSADGIYYELQKPELMLHCVRDTCNSLRYFRSTAGDQFVKENESKYYYITYRCSNCQAAIKTFSLYILVKDLAGGMGLCYKFGELPTYGPPTPARLIRLFGKDRDLFLRGRRCENQGLGIGAFVYYRRVVESHKDTILSEIIRVAEKIGAPAEMISTLTSAKREIQFSKSLDLAKDAMPQALLINGQNPLTLLHKALSVGVHDGVDRHPVGACRPIDIESPEIHRVVAACGKGRRAGRVVEDRGAVVLQ